jgi:hypothetical protein
LGLEKVMGIPKELVNPKAMGIPMELVNPKVMGIPMELVNPKVMGVPMELELGDSPTEQLRIILGHE